MQGLPGSAKVKQNGRAVRAQVNVGGFEIQMQQFVGVHFTQGIHDLGKHAPQRRFGDEGLVTLFLAAGDVILQRPPVLIAHHQIHRIVGAKEIQHSHDMWMNDGRE